MSRSLYSPRLSDDVVRALYREGRRRQMPMTSLADELLRQSLVAALDPAAEGSAVLHLHETGPAGGPDRETGAA